MDKAVVKEWLATGYAALWGTRLGHRTLMYHSVGSRLAHDTYGLSIGESLFREQMSALAETFGFPIVATTGEIDGPSSIAVTFDDGYRDNENAAVILSDLNIPFTIFVATSFIGTKDFLSESALGNLARNPLCTIGGHGHTHQPLSSLSDVQQRDELSRSKDILERICGRAVEVMSYPHGSHSHETCEIARALGYRRAYSSLSGANDRQTTPFEMRRTEILASDHMARFVKKLRGGYDYMALYDRFRAEPVSTVMKPKKSA